MILARMSGEGEEMVVGVGKSIAKLVEGRARGVIEFRIVEEEHDGISSDKMSSSYGIILIFVLRLNPATPVTILTRKI
jgi:hypothetical protein